ncbi:MAG: (d)CMP kinase [Lentisphaerae bacterium]|nr:(d)CMP kinase [Lentisphaerota bacterium]
MSVLIVAIDGPAASGKSSVSRQVAAQLGAVHVDTGAVYRGLTWKVLRVSGSWPEEATVLRLVRATQLDFFLEAGSLRCRLDGADPGLAIRAPEIGQQVSHLAALAPVREWVVAQLRDLVRFGDLVVEGRDIGTVVFPEAPFKFYLDADPAERARRRREEMTAAPVAPSLREVQQALLQRDALDSRRAASPLYRSADAQLIDTTRLSIAAVVEEIVRKVQEWKRQ